MSAKKDVPLLRLIRAAVFPFGDDRASDRDLLRRFAEERDESAFAALVRRHGAMVLGVGLRVLRCRQDAEDVCQATFLLLARKAKSLPWRDSVVNWLYGAAYRLALHAREAARRRVAREKRVAPRPVPDALADVAVRELESILDQELSRLPKKYAAILLLCCLEGRTRDEAARNLGLPVATVKSRLEDGLELLRRRLTRRGVELTTVLASATLLSSSASAALPLLLVRATSEAALQILAGETIAGVVSVSVSAMMRIGVQSMIVAKLKLVTAAVLAVGIVMGGIAAISQNAHVKAQVDSQRKKRVSEPIKQPVSEAKPEALPIAEPAIDSSETTTFRGHVVGPDGKPVSGARLYLVPDGPALPTVYLNYFGADKSRPSDSRLYAATEADGGFQFAIPKSRIGDLPVDLAASAPNLGAGWVNVAKGHRTDNLMIRLVADDVPILGQIVDSAGRPVEGAIVRVLRIHAAPNEDLAPWLADAQGEHLKEIRPAERLEFTHLSRSTGALPLAAPTDAKGHFQLTGVGRNRVVFVRLDGPKIASQLLHFRTQPGKAVNVVEFWDKQGGFQAVLKRTYYGAEFRHAALPMMSVTGVVRDIDSKKPLKDITIQSYSNWFGAGEFAIKTAAVRTTTDADGRYHLTGLAEGLDLIAAIPGNTHPYIFSQVSIRNAAADPVKIDIDLRRGVWIEGKVTDKVTGRPVQATVEYFGMLDNPNVPRFTRLDHAVWLDWRIVKTKEDGTYRVPGLSGAGLIAVHDKFGYVRATERVDEFALKEPFPNTAALDISAANNFTATALVDAPYGADTVERNLTLDPGWNFSISVLGPDGKSLAGLRSFDLTDHQWIRAGAKTTEFSAWFSPHRPRDILFQHLDSRLVGVAKPPSEHGGAVTVHMRPGATVVGHLVDGDGKTRAYVELELWFRPKDQTEWSLFSPPSLTTDRDGRFRIEALPPGYDFRFTESSKEYRFGSGLSSGETSDLGDVRTEGAELYRLLDSRSRPNK